MNYIDNSELFNQLPSNQKTSKGSKVAIVVLALLCGGSLIWAISNQFKIDEEKKKETPVK